MLFAYYSPDSIYSQKVTYLTNMAWVTIGVGVALLIGGVYILLNPRIQGARDVDLIESDSVSSAERYTAYIGAAIILLIGTGFLYLGIAY